ncbi:hypothetical protein Dsin_025652 [Dipteronia sinensis]|uniref:Uncharacterized protein n=1 Tax=Dipteronia sinensis TaxID=43782 RepID=A0AAE0DX62_9ROSI|nr:hypothetical protein Dsin_025652 [Dipteronia sinensis]
MEANVRAFGSANQQQSDEEMMMITDVRKGPWTPEEDSLLKNYVAIHGDGRWNSVARCAGLKRTGKSCRLRWLNYLRPDVRRGSISLQEQLTILELHSRFGNRWSKIAQHLPGRTDNEIKNYWRTRVQKQAKQLKCDVNSKQFRDAMRYVWIPRLLERIRATPDSSAAQPLCVSTTNSYTDSSSNNHNTDIASSTSQVYHHYHHHNHMTESGSDPNFLPELSGASSDSLDPQVSPVSDLTDCYNYNLHGGGGANNMDNSQTGSGLYPDNFNESWNWLGGGGDSLDNMWNDENIWFLQQQLLCDDI